MYYFFFDFRYARRGRGEEIEKLLNRGIPVDVKDEWGNTLLIIACQNGNKVQYNTVQYNAVQYNDTFFLKMLYPQFPSSFIYESHL